jgi:hypothetical protein
LKNRDNIAFTPNEETSGMGLEVLSFEGVIVHYYPNTCSICLEFVSVGMPCSSQWYLHPT